MKQTLKINDFEVWVHLGCLIEEQKYTQPVHFNFEINYQNQVKGTTSDKLEEATDYVALMEIILTIAQKKNYKLIEHLNHEVFLKLCDYLLTHRILGEVKLGVRKIRVPVENLRNGVEFSCQLTLS